eukprot:scaffold66749_cov51-Phaeocystis_antarctica.AAC.3
MSFMFNVRSSPCPAPNLQSRPALHAACIAVARSPPDPPHLAPHRMPSFRLSAGRVGVQPPAELRHLQGHEHVPHVPRALLPVPCPESAVEPSHARCLHRGRPSPPTTGAAPRPAPHALLSALGRTRRRSTRRSASTPLASRTCTTCSRCAPPHKP